MGELKNVFSWSKSRDEEFRECRRKYFYDRYASWGGWEKSAPEETRACYVLKNLKNRWAWKGETVHHQIENVLKELRSGRPAPLDRSLAHLTEVMRADYKSSKAKKYWQEPKKTVGLFEHEYEKPVTDETWKKMHDESAACLKNFYASSFFKELEADDKKSWLVIEDLEEFDFDGAKVYVKLDFARKKDGVIEIYDWKTGKDNAAGAELQMGAYAIYAMGKWKLPLSQIRAFLFYVSSPDAVPQEQVLSEKLIDESKKAMTESIENMKKLLKDPVNNIPLPRGEFPFTENARLCDSCNFFRVCEKYKA